MYTSQYNTSAMILTVLKFDWVKHVFVIGNQHAMLNVLAVNIFFAPYFAPCNYTFYLKENNFSRFSGYLSRTRLHDHKSSQWCEVEVWLDRVNKLRV